jgi:hypothetical protein
MDDGRLLGADAEKARQGRALTCAMRVMVVVHGAAWDRTGDSSRCPGGGRGRGGGGEVEVELHDEGVSGVAGGVP